MPSMNKVMLIGRVGKPPEMRYTPSGQAVTTFSLAVNKQYKNAAGETVKQTMWARVSAWGKLAETVNQYCDKGKLVFVDGEIAFDPNTGGAKVWTGQDGTPKANIEITAHAVTFLSKSEQSEQTQQDAPTDSEELPF